MPTIKFVNEKKTIEVEPGTNLRKAAMREGVELYAGVHKLFDYIGLAGLVSPQVIIRKGLENCSPQSSAEALQLFLGPLSFFTRMGHEKDLRLASNVQVNGDIEVETQPPVNWHGEKFWG